jgi:hypothetical protein
MRNFKVFNTTLAKPQNTWDYENDLDPGNRHSVAIMRLVQRGGAIIHAWL